MLRRLVMLVLAAALPLGALALAGCGGDADEETTSGSLTMTVYASVPLRGEGAAEGRDVLDGMKLALNAAGGRAGPFTVNLVALDPTDPETGRWSHEQVLANARAAIEDRNTIAYVGELASAASALALPVLNEGGVLQVSPLSTYTGLTRPTPAGRGEPERFSPSGRLTFGRVVPNGEVEAQAQMEALREADVRRLLVLRERGGRAEDHWASRDLALQVATAAREEGLEIVGEEALDPEGAGLRERVAGLVAEGAPDAAFYAGERPAQAARVLAALHAADPDLALHAPGALAAPALARALSPGTAARTRLTTPAPDLDAGRAARFAAAFRRAFGRQPRPEAAFGHAAMDAVLAAIRSAGAQGNDREAVIAAFFGLSGLEGPLGRYDVDVRGDTTLDDLAVLRVRDGRLLRRPDGA